MNLAKNSRIYFQSEILQQHKDISHAFFTRNGGYSNKHYDSLNCNINSDDSKINVAKNLNKISKIFCLPNKSLKILKQIHSNYVAVISDINQDLQNTKADALVTNLPHLLLGIQSADCTPILLFDFKNKIIGAIHAGWKGAIAGIIDNTVNEMLKLGSNSESMIAAVGPTIQQNSYEVDLSFYQKFLSKSSENKIFFIPSNKINHFMFNLPGYCKYTLRSQGIKTIDDLNFDTYSNTDLFFSCRRATHEHLSSKQTIPIKFGTQLSLIGLKSVF